MFTCNILYTNDNGKYGYRTHRLSNTQYLKSDKFATDRALVLWTLYPMDRQITAFNSKHIHGHIFAQ